MLFLKSYEKCTAPYTSYRVFLGFRLNLVKLARWLCLGSLLTTFDDMSNNFGFAWSKPEIKSSLRLNHHIQEQPLFFHTRIRAAPCKAWFALCNKYKSLSIPFISNIKSSFLCYLPFPFDLLIHDWIQFNSALMKLVIVELPKKDHALSGGAEVDESNRFRHLDGKKKEKKKT